jgi:hypothetical protein
MNIDKSLLAKNSENYILVSSLIFLFKRSCVTPSIIDDGFDVRLGFN